jgi:hypothetical protein
MEQEPSNREQGNEHPEQSPNWKQVVGSVMAAAIGVQSKQNRERDFQHGKPVVFITAGIIFTVAFIAAVIAVVSMVLKTAG